jgi:hypothetical protein
MRRPHIRMVFGRWHCYSRGHYGVGDTPTEAHAAWYVHCIHNA